MLRASRVLLAKNAVRPNLGATKSTAESGSNGLHVTPLGVAFVLGGLALGSYVLKPTTRMPTAAMDTFKPHVAIVFAKGDSHGAAEKAAADLKFQYLNLRKDIGRLGSLADQGYTRILIDGFADTKEVEEVENELVAADLVLDFDTEPVQGPRIVPVGKSDSVASVIKERNLA